MDPMPAGAAPGLNTTTAEGGAISRQLGAVLANFGLPVKGPVAQPDTLTMDAPKETLSPVIALFEQERMAAMNFRLNGREQLWQRFQANIAKRSLASTVTGLGNSSVGAPKANTYTTSTIMLPKSSEVHERGTADLLRMLNPVSGYPLDVRVWRDGQIDPQVSSELKTKIKNQWDGLDYGQLCRKLAPNLMAFGVGYVDGPVRPPASEMEWKAGPNGRMLVAAQDDTQCWFDVLDTMKVFPDPTVSKVQDAGYFFIHAPKTRWQMEQLAGSLKDPSGAKRVLEKDPYLTETRTEQHPQTESLKRYDVWRRVGFLTQRHFDALKGSGAIGADKAYEPGAAWDVWYEIGTNTVIKAEIRNARPNRLPVIVVPLLDIPGEYWPHGLQDAMSVMQELLDKSTRALDDQLADTNGVNLLVDPKRVQANNYRVEGRKTWFLTEDELMPEGRAGKPFEFFEIPNQIAQVTNTIQFVMSMIPEITGLPSYAFQPAATLGSGIRTEGQQTQLMESAATWIRHVMGSMDEHLIEPMAESTADFIARQDASIQMLGTVKIVAMGMQGAIRREIMVRRMLEAIPMLQASGLVEMIDPRRCPEAIFDALGFGGEGFTMSNEEYVQFQAAQAAKMMAMENAKNAATPTHEVKERAMSSVRDSLGTMFKSIMDRDTNNPVASFVAEQLMESCGRANDGFYAGLTVWRRRDALLAQQDGTITPQEVEIFNQTPGPESPAELEPGSGNGAPAPSMMPDDNPSGSMQDTAPPMPQPAEAAVETYENPGGMS